MNLIKDIGHGKATPGMIQTSIFNKTGHIVSKSAIRHISNYNKQNTMNDSDYDSFFNLKPVYIFYRYEPSDHLTKRRNVFENIITQISDTVKACVIINLKKYILQMKIYTPWYIPVKKYTHGTYEPVWEMELGKFVKFITGKH